MARFPSIKTIFPREVLSTPSSIYEPEKSVNSSQKKREIELDNSIERNPAPTQKKGESERPSKVGYLARSRQVSGKEDKPLGLEVTVPPSRKRQKKNDKNRGGTMNTVTGTFVQVWVEIYGRRQPIYIRPDDGKPFVEALIGQPYAIGVRNMTRGRIMVVGSVDGWDVLEQMPADPHNDGYILEPYGSYTIKGFRVDAGNVAEFVFGRKAAGRSVAAQSGDSTNVGALGIAVFQEYRPEPIALSPNIGIREIRDFSPLESLAYSKGGPDAATEAGDTVHDQVRYVTFERATWDPIEVVEIQYGTRAWLQQNGIWTPTQPRTPSAFPAGTGYTKIRRRPGSY